MDQSIRKRPVPLKEEEQAELYQHFKDEAELAQHLREVREAQEQFAAPF